MSTIINATTTNGVVIQPDNSGSLVLQTNNGTTALTIDTSQNATFAGTLTATGKLASSSMPTGTILQTSQAIFTGTQTIVASGFGAFADVTSLSVTITPSSLSNKILLIAQVTASLTVDRICYAKFTGGNTATFIGDANGSRTRVATFSQSGSAASAQITCPINMTYLDSPATTSAITYKVQIAPNFSSGNIGINYAIIGDSSNAYIPAAASSLIVMEVKG
jgi:hypothetical protein